LGSGSVGAIRLGGCVLDLARGVLERDGRPVEVRPKTFAFLAFLAGNQDRVLAKSEIVDAVWGVTAVTDDSIAQLVADARRALGPSGEALRTVPRRGYLFASGRSVAATPRADPPAPGSDRAARRARRGGRAAVAVLAFATAGAAAAGPGARDLRDGLLRDIVRNLSRLRLLFVIAANSSLALDPADPLAAAARLDVDYVATGTLVLGDASVRVDLEVLDVETGLVIFAERYARALPDIGHAADELSGEIASAVAREVDLVERNRSISVPVLDAWTAYHRGQWHMHRFTGPDNDAAAALFRQAADLDPTFCRPYSGLSFTHFLKAYLLDPRHRSDEALAALSLAQQALSTDPLDPGAQCAYGRALWLLGDTGQASEALGKAVALSPSYAFGHYARAFAEASSGDPVLAIESAHLARELSPFDPFMGPMMATLAMSLIRLGRGDEAAEWGERATRQPNAHPHVLRIGALSLVAGGRLDEAAPLVARINRESAGNGGELFLGALRVAPEHRDLFRDLSRRSGLR
jgi:TolB-like protein